MMPKTAATTPSIKSLTELQDSELWNFIQRPTSGEVSNNTEHLQSLWHQAEADVLADSEPRATPSWVPKLHFRFGF